MQVLLPQLLLLHFSSSHGGSFYNTCFEAGYSLYRRMQSPQQAVRFALTGVLWTYVRWLLYRCLNILALQYPDSGKLSTDVPDVDTGIDWLVYLARYSQQCQAQSHFVVRSRLDIVENTEIMVGPNQSFYCGTLRPDCRPFRTGIFRCLLQLQSRDSAGVYSLLWIYQAGSRFLSWNALQAPVPGMPHRYSP